VKAVLVESTFRGYVVAGTARAPVAAAEGDASPARWASAVKALLAESGLSFDAAVVALPGAGASSLAVTLPSDVVKEFKLKKGQKVDVSVHPQSGAVTIRPGIKYFENGKVTKKFEAKADELLERRKKVYRALAR
jgi:antitoxin component of MazEF toxin-antitoxin module